MSFRFYIRVLMDASETEIYNNTTSVTSYQDGLKISVVGLRYQFASTFTDSTATKRYIQPTLPVYSIAYKNSFEFQPILDPKTRNANYEAFKRGIQGTGADYVIVYINNLNGLPLDSLISSYLEKFVGSTVLADKTSGGWAVLLRQKDPRPYYPRRFDILVEKYSADNDIDFCYLTSTEFTYLNKDTWNTIFLDNCGDEVVVPYYQLLFEALDVLIYADESDYLQILAHIDHHLTYLNDEETEPYYNSNPDELESDMLRMREIVVVLARQAKDAGIDILTTTNSARQILRNCDSIQSFLSSQNATELVTYRDLYVEIRNQFKDKLSLTL